MIQRTRAALPTPNPHFASEATEGAATTLLIAGSVTFLASALLAVAAAGMLVAGGVAQAQVRLASASVDTMFSMQEVCTSRPHCANPLRHQPAVRNVC